MLLELHEVQSPDTLAPEVRDQQKNAEHKTEIADAVYDESLISRDRVGVILVPKPDKKIGTETHTLPTDEEHQKVISHHQQEHEEDKQVQIHEETNHAFVVTDIAERIDMNQKADAGDDEQHHCAQGIDLKRKSDLK